MDIAKEFGKKLVTKRQEVGLTQLKLSLIAEVDRSYIGRIERGEVNVTIDMVYKLASALDCTAQDLLP